ncbi:MAG TPA: glycosyltransferase, partial [Gemmataceae bacterium]|nr:glycosyltransferase [Gemmataceae bacterium]
MSAPLHVVHGVLTLDVGGLERIVLSLAREGRLRGHRVSIVCVEAPGQLADEVKAAGAEVVALGKPPGRLPAYIQKAKSLFDQLTPDVIHTHQIGAAWYLGRAAKSAGLPVLHTEHGNEFARTRGLLEALKVRLFLRQAAKSVDRFCCVSDEIAAAVSRWRTVPRAKVEVVPNGIPIETSEPLRPAAAVRAALGIPDGAAVVGTVGRLAEVKRQDLLVRAVATLPGVHAVVVGDGDRRGLLEGLARQLGAADRVHCVGYQSRPEQYLQVMDVFALTSRSEGFPVSLLEAWRAGVPAVCTAVGGIPRVVTPGTDGILIPAGDATALAAELGRLLADEPLRKRLALAGNAAVRERYSLERMASEYERRYR